MVEIKNLAQLETQLDQWEAEVYELTRQVLAGISAKLFNAILVRSAQYSGDYAANWKYSIGAPDLSFEPGLFEDRSTVRVGDYGRFKGMEQHRKEGDGEAVVYAQNQARSAFGSAALGETIFISNAAAHDEPYARLIEDGKIKFRSGHVGHTVERAMDAMARYTEIDDKAAQALRREKI